MKLRWRIAYALNRLPGQCWPDLIHWALKDPGEEGYWNPWSPATDTCRMVLPCYCEKLQEDR